MTISTAELKLLNKAVVERIHLLKYHPLTEDGNELQQLTELQKKLHFTLQCVD